MYTLPRPPPDEAAAKDSFPRQITTLDGRIYKSVRILKVKPDGLEVQFKPDKGGIGIATIRLANLPSDLRRRYYADALASEDRTDEGFSEFIHEIRAEAELGRPVAQFQLGFSYQH